jgi:glutathione S-transferase
MITLYGSNLSYPAIKARLAANALKIDHRYVEVNLLAAEQKKPDFLSINPIGKVPALDHDGFHLFESDAIVRYLAQLQPNSFYPQATEPESTRLRATIDQWMCYTGHHIGTAISKVMFNTHFFKIMGADRDERSFKEGSEMLQQNLSKIEERLTASKFLAGNTLSIADLCFIATIDPIDVLDIDLTVYKKVRVLREMVQEEPYYKAIHRSFGTMFQEMLSSKALN